MILTKITDYQNMTVIHDRLLTESKLNG